MKKNIKVTTLTKIRCIELRYQAQSMLFVSIKRVFLWPFVNSVNTTNLCSKQIARRYQKFTNNWRNISSMFQNGAKIRLQNFVLRNFWKRAISGKMKIETWISSTGRKWLFLLFIHVSKVELRLSKVKRNMLHNRPPLTRKWSPTFSWIRLCRFAKWHRLTSPKPSLKLVIWMNCTKKVNTIAYNQPSIRSV